MSETVQMVPLAKIVTNPWNPNVVPDAILSALRENIRRYGFNQPVLLRAKGDLFEIVDGEHRFLAASTLEEQERIEILGEDEAVPAIVREFSDAEAKAQTLAMNKLRGEMEPAEVARLVREIEEDGLTVPELAEFTGYQEEELEGLTNLLDFDWDKYGSPPADPLPSDPGDEWVTLSYRCPAEVAALFEAGVDRIKTIRETEHDHLALEVMAVLASQANAAELDGEGG